MLMSLKKNNKKMHLLVVNFILKKKTHYKIMKRDIVMNLLRNNEKLS